MKDAENFFSVDSGDVTRFMCDFMFHRGSHQFQIHTTENSWLVNIMLAVGKYTVMAAVLIWSLLLMFPALLVGAMFIVYTYLNWILFQQYGARYLLLMWQLGRKSRK
jgi:hypothetical protein